MVMRFMAFRGVVGTFILLKAVIPPFKSAERPEKTVQTIT